MAELVSFSIAFLIAAIAGIWDWRTGKIPNWLTLPPLVLAPFVFGIGLGPKAALRSLIALILCGLVPYFMFRKRAMGGGDVKLFAALGAITGGIDLMSGVEIQLAAFITAMVLTLAAMAWNGHLLHTLSNAFFVALNPVLPESKRREVSRELMTPVRMGIPIMVATGIIAVPLVSRYLLLS